MEELILIDGNSLLFKAFYATSYTGNYMVNRNGIPTNGVYGFARMVEKIISTNPKYVIVAFDYGKKTFRNELLDTYKATRKETPQELVPQFALAREYLTAHNITWYEIEGYEGDDIIGTLVDFGEKNNLKVSVYTGDKDANQLISPQTTIYRTVKGVTELDIYNEQTLLDKYGLKPDQFRDFLGLMGDSSDNIPGIKGVGEKTALKLLHQYGTIEGLQEHQDEIKGKMGEKIRAGMEDALMSKKVATILRDIPIDVDLEKATYQGYDYETLKSFYEKYDMNSLIKSMTTEAAPKKELKLEIVDHMPEITKDSAVYPSIYDTNYHRSIILGYGIYNDEQAYFISYENALKDESFLAYLKDENKKKYGYDIKSAVIGSRWNGIEINGYTFDLSLASYVLEPAIKEELKYVCTHFDYEGVQYDEEVFGKGAKKHIPDDDILANHIVSKAKAIYELKDVVTKELKDKNQYELYEDIELPVTRILGEMEFAGTEIDLDVLKEMDTAFDETIEKLANDIYRISGTTFNISSPKQLGQVLFEDLGLKGGKKTKTGYSTSQDVLEKIIDAHPVVPLVLEYRMLTKLSSTYLKGLQEQVFPDNKIHTIYKQTLTHTGRLSSVDPNLQNIPVRSEEGKLIRKAFVSHNGYLVSFDYSQIELRILAHMAHVTNLIDAFNQGKDIHRHTAALVFGVKDEEVTPQMRSQAKAVNFGIIYGMSEFRLSKDIGMSISEARDFINKYFETYPEVKTYMDEVVETCKKQGYVSTLLNRKRYIPTINDKNFMVRQQAQRYAMNTPIQGTGADILKLAMIEVDKALKEKNLKSQMILQVHDELIFDVFEDELEEVMSLVKEKMENCIKMDVPLIVEGNYAKNWCELK
ncbi:MULTISPECIES: DNA polymerase I [Catenibacterium]|uniref:DNA polymerase I n=2 Tax=Catenibacterium TaxID=135858 RepID=A0AAW4MRE6_9FIRM|nr:DNA polymerase I [Catenibacterium mitsuokai]MBV3366619.1 DNA polymerase I [Catenibacterium mitsuokai]MBV3370649.1 DNA polymerase I [Catenibacterium mitsuokai]MBV3375956.1 DNA polymerase I [Catenibacterium mitsuokai]MBV3378145.1 DNA polymerase I [Catenibacterium mitsuokai]MBV3380479.1 DNA polymerase I [Catenibacterium mitsuokai]